MSFYTIIKHMIYYHRIKFRMHVSATPCIHDDVIKWKQFPSYRPFVRGIHRSLVDSPKMASDAELWCFLWSVPKKTLNNQAWRRCVDTSSCSWCRHCAEYSIGSRHELDWFDMGGKQFRLSFDLLMMCLCVTNVFGMFSVHSDDDMFSTSLNVCWADNITTEYLVSYRLDAVLTTTWAIIFTNAGSIVNSNLGNKLQWNQQDSYIFIKENSFENIVWKIADILSRPQCVDKQR